MTPRLPICDLDGTLIDSDVALAGAFLALGIAAEDITYGHVLAEECQRLGLKVDEYLNAYDVELCVPFDGVNSLIDSLDQWAVCSNKHPDSGKAELARLGWTPKVALFADSFEGPKRLEPVLHALQREPNEVLFLGDTQHDRDCAKAAGVRFVLAGWNPRVVAEPTDVVLSHPLDLLNLLD